MNKLVALVFLVACGGGGSKPAATKPATTEQSLPDALAQMCAAPARAKADPAWQTDQSMTVMGPHMEEGITNPKVRQYLDAVKQGSVVDNTQLDALLAEAAMKPESCEVRIVFTPGSAKKL